jgi:hypothetical protein
VLPFIFDIDSLEMPPGAVAELISIVLGFLALFLGRNYRTTRRLAVIVLLTWLALFIWAFVSFLADGSANFLRPC